MAKFKTEDVFIVIGTGRNRQMWRADTSETGYVLIDLNDAKVFLNYYPSNSDVLALVQQGLSDVAQGKVSKVDLDTI